MQSYKVLISLETHVAYFTYIRRQQLNVTVSVCTHK